ncbi:MAG: hypothetical protein V4479_03625 [Actinomycetota bacterium]
MPRVLRAWLAFAAIGCAVIHLALVINSPLPLAVVLVLLGVIEFAWGVLTLARDRILFPRASRIGAIAPVLLWSLVVVLATLLDAPAVTSYFNFIPMFVATVFELFIALTITTVLRYDVRPAKVAGAGRYLLGMFAGAVIVAALTTSALSFTTAGSVDPHAAHFFTDTGHAGH